jgi:hypothetical protein
MNRQALKRRTERAEMLRDRHNPPYRCRVWYLGGVIHQEGARTRGEARIAKQRL